MLLRQGRRRVSPLRASLAGGVVAVLALAGCSGEPAAPGEPAERGDRPPAAEVVDTWPLTGLPVEDDGSSARRHPVLVLKMDNTASSAPQRGLSAADLVVEEQVEGGVTRLAVFYYSDIPGVVGPVRSMRATDIGIVAPVDATMVTSGAAAPTIARLAKSGVPFVTEGSAGFSRDPARSAPYDLVTDMGEVARTLAKGSAPVRPPDYLPFGTGRDLPAGEPARAFAARFSPAHTTSWAYRDGRYVDVGSLAADGDAFPADTVLVLRVRVGDAGYLDPAGNTVPETKLVGRGDALLFHGGRLVRGTWSKATLDGPITLSRPGAGGEPVPLTVPAGRTWIELVPLSGGVDLS